MLFRRAPQKVEELKIVIVGAGEVGFHIAQRLSEEQKQVVVIDQNPDKLRRIEDNMDVQTVLGSGSIPSVLKNAGAGDAAIFLAVTDSDETNISMLINPEQEIVRSIERLLTLPGAVEYGQLADGFIRMVGMRVESGPLIEQPLTRFREIVQDDGIMVGAIARGQKLIVPSGSDVIKAGDTVYFAYKPTSQRALLRALHKTRGSLGTACIVGGGNIGLRLARLLENKGVDTKLIDISEERCEQLADQLQGTLVLHGDGTDKSLLQEEHIDQMDAFIAVTGDEESNILSCLLAKSLGVKETVARVNKAAYLPLVEAIGIAHSVSPRLSAVNSILQYIRQGKVLSSVSVGGDAAEMLEALVDEESLVAGKRVHELGLPKGILLLGVIRGGEAFIPSGQTVIQPQDRIVLLSLREKMSKLEGIVSKKKE